jgi:hypothetical protein
LALTLDSCLAKIAHAQKHLESLQRELETWIQSRPYAVITHEEADANTHTFWFVLGHVFDAPAPIGLIFGDYVHNLRSALDHLVWALAVNNKGGKEPKNANAVGFPVADNPRAFYDAPVLRELTWEQATVLERFQPYRGGDAPRALGDLNLFWNDDKHRLVQPVLARVKRMPIYDVENVASVVSEWFEGKKPLKPNTEIARVVVIPSGPEPNVQMKNVPVEVAFGQRRRLIHDDVPTLRDVASQIILDCKQFFP